jgi:hypothetical protein
MNMSRQSTLILFVFAFIGCKGVAATLSEDVAALENDQTVIFVPVGMDGIIIFIPTGTGLPPDPADSGKLTIQGVDSDNDGIRDDVERRISAYYPNNPTARAYSYIMAGYYQQIIENPLNKQLQLSLIQNLGQVENCLELVLPGEPDAGAGLLRPWVLDTYERSYAYIEAQKLISGEVLPSIPACK